MARDINEEEKKGFLDSCVFLNFFYKFLLSTSNLRLTIGPLVYSRFPKIQFADRYTAQTN